jgi:hypothetical protein
MPSVVTFRYTSRVKQANQTRKRFPLAHALLKGFARRDLLASRYQLLAETTIWTAGAYPQWVYLEPAIQIDDYREYNRNIPSIFE